MLWRDWFVLVSDLDKGCGKGSNVDAQFGSLLVHVSFSGPHDDYDLEAQFLCLR